MSPALPSRTTRRSARAVGLTLALALGLSGCGAGLRAQTYQERTTSDSTTEAIGAIAVRHIRVLPPPDGQSYDIGDDARVAFVLVNEGARPDRLVSVTTDSASSVAVAGPGGKPATLTVPAQSGGISQYTFVLRGLTRELRPAQYVQMELVFAENGAETMLVPIEVTGTPGPKREGYHVGETDSEGNPLPEEEEEEEQEEPGTGGAEERPELDNDGGDSGSGDQDPLTESAPSGDDAASTSAPLPRG